MATVRFSDKNTYSPLGSSHVLSPTAVGPRPKRSGVLHPRTRSRLARLASRPLRYRFRTALDRSRSLDLVAAGATKQEHALVALDANPLARIWAIATAGARGWWRY